MKQHIIILLTCLLISNISLAGKDEKTSLKISLHTKGLQDGVIIIQQYQIVPSKKFPLDTFKVSNGKALIPLNLKSPIFFNARFKSSIGASYKFVRFDVKKNTMFNAFFLFKKEMLLEEDSVYSNSTIICKPNFDQDAKLFDNLFIVNSIDTLECPIKKHPNSYFLLSKIHSLLGTNELSSNKKKARAILTLFNASVKSTIYYKDVVSYLNRTFYIENGVKLPNIKLADNHGHPVYLINQIKKPTLLVFWATWCGPCRKELEYLSQIGTDKIPYEVATISIDEDFQQWSAYLPKLAWNCTNYIWNPDTADEYGINAIPRAVIINKEGVVIDSNFNIYTLK